MGSCNWRYTEAGGNLAPFRILHIWEFLVYVVDVVVQGLLNTFLDLDGISFLSPGRESIHSSCFVS